MITFLEESSGYLRFHFLKCHFSQSKYYLLSRKLLYDCDKHSQVSSDSVLQSLVLFKINKQNLLSLYFFGN
jgi:hypothetical protein